MSDFTYRQKPDDGQEGHDGNDNDDQGHNIHDTRELTQYVHDMLRALERITAGRSLTGLSRGIGEARKIAASLLFGG